MGRKFQYVTLDRVLSKIYRDLGLQEISEVDVVEWTGEALEAIGAIGIYEQKVTFSDVKNHHAELPNGFHAIVQIARNNQKDSLQELITEVPYKELTESTGVLKSANSCVSCDGQDIDTTGYPVPLDRNGTPLVEFDVAYYRPFNNQRSEYVDWKSNAVGYTPVRLAAHSFFNSIVCPEAEGLYQNSQDEYTIIDDRLRFSFKDGVIALAYYRQKLDDKTGYPMIPDDYSVITAITMYITMKYMARLWYMGREGYGDKMQKAEADWQWYCRQAGNKILAPFGLDEYQDILDSSSHLLKRKDRYYGFFGKLAEIKSYFNSHGK